MELSVSNLVVWCRVNGISCGKDILVIPLRMISVVFPLTFGKYFGQKVYLSLSKPKYIVGYWGWGEIHGPSR